MRGMTVLTPIGRACGKVILLGEHFVVHGAPALAAPLLAWETEVTLLADATCIDAPGVSREDVLEALALATGAWGRPLPGIRVRSTLPIGAGLGSSAAFATALVRALAQSLPEPVDGEERARVVHLLEERVHGTPSGLDGAVVGQEALVRFERGRSPELVPCAADLCLVVADSGSPGSTSAEVARVRTFAKQRPDRFEDMVREASDDVEAGVRALATGDLALLGARMSAAHERLRECGVSTPALDQLVAAALDAGAGGAKLTGAGGGGSIVALASAEEAEIIAEALAKSGARHVIVSTLKGGQTP